MKNRAGDIIYVGKSRNLKRRVSSYFAARRRKDIKISRILEQLHSLETVVCPSEVEALLLEMRMIKDFRPPINLQAEVHEDRVAYGKGKNLLLLVAREGGEKADVYFLADGMFAGKSAATLGRTASPALRKKVRSVFDPRSRRKKTAPKPGKKKSSSDGLPPTGES